MTYWKVNSYGYPNPFALPGEKAHTAWETLLSFSQHTTYSGLKAHWASSAAARPLSTHAIESWKATFEEFGLLFVISRSDQIRITAGGRQFIDAGLRGDQPELERIGLTLLLRYPLCGPPRRGRGPLFDQSDLLLYRFILAAMMDLDRRLWRTELEHVLSGVFRTSAAAGAVTTVEALRTGQRHLSAYPLPVAKRAGAFYNSLNQVLVHASMNFLLMHKATEDSPYTPGSREPSVHLLANKLPLMRKLLGGGGGCSMGRFTDRLPTAPPRHRTEEAYFAYIGAAVPPSPVAAQIPRVALGGQTVAVLQQGTHVTASTTTTMTGPIALLCALRPGSRVIRTSDLSWTWIIESKQQTGPDTLTLTVRKARPITSLDALRGLLKELP